MTADQVRQARTLIVDIIGSEVRLTEDIEELEFFCCDGSKVSSIPRLSSVLTDAATAVSESDVDRDGPEVETVLNHILEELSDAQ